MTQMPFSHSPEWACPQVPDPATAGSFFNSTGLFPDSLFPNTKSRGVVSACLRSFPGPLESLQGHEDESGALAPEHGCSRAVQGSEG